MVEQLPIYDSIDRPYDNFLNRGADNTPSINSEESPTTNSTNTIPNAISSSSIESQVDSGGTIKSGSALTDVWIDTWLKSRNYLPKTEGFLIDARMGYIECMRLYVGGGGIIGGSLDIPDTTTANSFHVNSTGNMWLGATTFAAAPFSVANTGSLIATSGTIGGCALGATSIGSTTFVSGVSGTGWNISNTGTAEFLNIIARGELRTSVFAKDEIHASSGSLIVLGASTLKTDFTSVTTPATSTLDLVDPSSGHAQLFTINDIIRIKDGSGKDNWLKVTAASNQTTFYRYTVDKQSGTNGTFTAGTAVVNYKQATDGQILLTSDETNAPYINIALNGATPWVAPTNKVRLGWLKGITDADVGLATTDTWGLYTDNAYIKGTVVATAGKFGTTTNYWSVGATGLTATSSSTDVVINYGKTDFGQDSTEGFILGYDYSGSSGHKSKFEIGSSATKILKYDGTDFSLIGGTITGGTIQTASSGSRMVIYNNTTKYDIINAHGDTNATMNWSSTTDAVLKLNPIYDARRALEIAIPASFAGAGAEADAKAITIDNLADSISIDITNGGLYGLYMRNSKTSVIDIVHAGSAAAIAINSTAPSAIDIIHTAGYGISITPGAAATLPAIFIDSNAGAGNVAIPIDIDQDANCAPVVTGIRIDSANNGTGGAIGLKITAKTIAIDTSAMPQGVANLKVIADTTSIATSTTDSSGRIAIDVGGSIKYIPYF